MNIRSNLYVNDTLLFSLVNNRSTVLRRLRIFLLGDVVRKLDKISTGDKEKVVPEVNELHIILEELGDRIEKLKKECPTSWAPDRTEIENKIGYLRTKLFIEPDEKGGRSKISLPFSIPYLRPRSFAAGLSKSSFFILLIIGFFDLFAAAINSFSVLNFFKRSAFEGAGLPESV